MKALIERDAKDFTYSEGIEVGVLPYGDNVVHNASPYNDVVTNLLRYEFSFNGYGDYELWIEYAAKDSRPCLLEWRGKPIHNNTIAEVTGGWEEGFQKWHRIGVIAASPGIKTLKILRYAPFPHIRRIKMVLVNS